MITLPKDVESILKQLNQNGFEAYAVGGCIRDSLLGRVPQDWDICTSAFPEQTKACFRENTVLETGIQHGTVTLRMNHKSYEITTFRTEGEYRDCRRPDKVEFVCDITEDLARRDFTVNAMAYHPDSGLVDCFGGEADLQQKVIRCVGNPVKRFSEDALRIMRALRFAAVYGFQIAEDTKNAVFSLKDNLRRIAVERISEELKKLLLSEKPKKILEEYAEVFGVIIPEILPMIGFEQKNPWHCYDVWQHTLYSVSDAPKDFTVRLAMLFHDIGKPQTYSEDANGIGHFYGHADVSATLCRGILRRMRFDNQTIHDTEELIKFHGSDIADSEKAVKRWLNRLGTVQFQRLLEVKKADANALKEPASKLKAIADIQKILEHVLEEKACFSLKDLAVNGKDMIALGITEGPAIGEKLQMLLDCVIDNQVENTKEALLSFIENQQKES